MHRLKILLGLFTLFSLRINAQPALPEQGYRWVLNDELSDEFDGTELNGTKWKNTDPSRWIGRPPGLFMKEAVSVANGNMRLTTDLLPEPTVVNGNTFTHQGAHIISQKRVKPGSFIECRMKANKTFMSSTFWLIDYSNENTGCDRRVTELDIQECIGYPSSKSQTQRMGSNTHSRNIPAECTQIASGSRGNHADTPGKVYDDFYTYGAWWKSPTEILFYLNGQYVYTIEPYAEFNLELYIKLVCETYDWNPAPADGGMSGTWEERTTFYDWVRTYTYLPVDEAASSTSNIFTEEAGFTSKPTSLNSNNLKFNVNYKANSDKKLVMELKNNQGFVVADTSIIAFAGFGNLSMEINGTTLKGAYKAVVSLRNSSDDMLIDSETYDVTILSETTSIDLDLDKSIHIRPNPVKEHLSIVGIKFPATYEIYSTTGNQTISGKIDEPIANINVSNLSPGGYILFLTSENFKKSFKFIKTN